ECLARPVLVERLIRERYAADTQSQRAVNATGTKKSRQQVANKPPSNESFDSWWAKVKGRFSVTEPSVRIDGQAPRRASGSGHITTGSFVAKPINMTKGLLPGAVTKTEPEAAYKLPVISPAALVQSTPANTVTGGAWSPNTWSAISRTNAPALRANETAVWTGAEMIVWGGLTFSDVLVVNNVLNTGGRYKPAANSWTPTNLNNAPAARFVHTAVWTGTEMIVWGGADSNGSATQTGARYNPSTNSWTATSLTDAPGSRLLHTAVWTGTEMIIWGGGGVGSGDNSGGK